MFVMHVMCLVMSYPPCLPAAARLSFAVCRYISVCAWCHFGSLLFIS